MNQRLKGVFRNKVEEPTIMIPLVATAKKKRKKYIANLQIECRPVWGTQEHEEPIDEVLGESEI